MKTFILFIFINLWFIEKICSLERPEKFVSIEGAMFYPFYFMKYDPKFNYGYSAFISVNYTKIKVSLGLAYSTKNYNENFNDYSGISYRTYRTSYIKIPLIVSYYIIKKDLNIYSGFVFSFPQNFNAINYYTLRKGPEKLETPYKKLSGFSMRIGSDVGVKISTRVEFKIHTFFDYLIKEDAWYFKNSAPLWHLNYSNDRFSLCIGAGIEYDFIK